MVMLTEKQTVRLGVLLCLVAVTGGIGVGVHNLRQVTQPLAPTAETVQVVQPETPSPEFEPLPAENASAFVVAERTVEDAEFAALQQERMYLFEELTEQPWWPEPALIDDPAQWDAAVADAMKVVEAAAAGTSDQQLIASLFAAGYEPERLVISDILKFSVGELVYFYRDETATMTTARVNLATELTVSGNEESSQNIAAWTVDLLHDGQRWLATSVQMDSIRSSSNVSG